MRPRHICRGNTRLFFHAAGAPRCFNEAAAYLPRERADSPAQRTPTPCFNEAAAYLPREPAPRGRLRATPGAASMRPRHICRGNAHAGCQRVQRPVCFNEAAAYLPRERAADRAIHGRLRCFNEAAAYLPRELLHCVSLHISPTLASMRPRHICRGNATCGALFRHADDSFNEAAAYLPRERTACNRLWRKALTAGVRVVRRLVPEGCWQGGERGG